MKTSEIFVDVEIPPIDLHALNKPILGMYKKIIPLANFVGNNWIYFFVAGVILLLLLFGPIVDWVYTK